MLDERESFLCAIYDSPDDPTPRLVYADWLEEHGEVAAGRYLRLVTLIGIAGSEAEKIPLRQMFEELRRSHQADQFAAGIVPWVSGEPDKLNVAVDRLESLQGFRILSIANPKWFAAVSARIVGRRIPDATQIRDFFETAVARNIQRLDVSGEIVTDGPEDAITVEVDPGRLPYRILPFFTPRAFAEFIDMKATNRLTRLDLRNNNLDNDALRALARSPHLARLKRLYLSEGNTFRGRVWQQVLERFGPDVVE